MKFVIFQTKCLDKGLSSLLGYGAHLHLHVYLSPKDVTDFLDLIITGEGENQIIYATKKKDTFVVNPFDYSEKRFLEK